MVLFFIFEGSYNILNETFCRFRVFIFRYRGNSENAELAESKSSKLCLRQNNVNKFSRQIRKAFLGLFDVQRKTFREFCELCGINLASFEG